ncbi:MAG: FeoA family protein [Anaerolineales bacterium]
MRLVDVEQEKEVRIVDIQGGKGVARKLQQLSLMPGDRVRVTKRAPLKGPLLVEAHGRSVALGRGVAAKVEVEQISS